MPECFILNGQPKEFKLFSFVLPFVLVEIDSIAWNRKRNTVFLYIGLIPCVCCCWHSDFSLDKYDKLNAEWSVVLLILLSCSMCICAATSIVETIVSVSQRMNIKMSMIRVRYTSANPLESQRPKKSGI